ncbi:MAG: DUF6261 family protein [Tannerellaceae bacterium]|jgi:hypothetical protein|nr:DUF6261 family protein [Tannerellaceae bacterium]
MKVLRISLKSLRNEEWFDLLTTFIKEVTRAGADVLGLVILMTRLLPLYNHVDQLLQVLRKSVYTKELETANKKRLDTVRGFYSVVNGSQKLPETNKCKAAIRLFNLLKGYQKALRGGYSEVSGTINNLVQDLEGPYAADITELGFDVWVTAIKQAEDEFLALRDERYEETTAKPKGNLRDVRTQADIVYSAAMNVLDAQLIADGLGGDIMDEEEYEPGNEPEEEPSGPTEDRDTNPAEPTGNATYNFVLAWNDILKKYRNLLNQRAGRRAKKEEEDEDSGPVED